LLLQHAESATTMNILPFIELMYITVWSYGWSRNLAWCIIMNHGTAWWIILYAWKIQNGTYGNVHCHNFCCICLMQLLCWNNVVYGSALLWVILNTSVCQGMEILCHWGLNNVV
jgi:hypothetical protein